VGEVGVDVISSSPDGVDIGVRVVTRASRPGLAGSRDGELLMRLQSAPIGNAANEELVERIAGILRVPKRAVSITGGGKTRNKRLHVAGLDVQTARLRLGLDPI
jgi:uncharacterized protein YggU (UPF0235/DUF167 family)